jgi:hypothetical protein
MESLLIAVYSIENAIYFLESLMLIQTILQNLMGKRKKAASPTPEKELSPMAQSIMQKLAEHEKKSVSDPKSTGSKENIVSKSDD